MKLIASITGLALVAFLSAASAGWGVLAIQFSDLRNDSVRNALAAAFGLISLAALIALLSRRWRWRALAT